MLKRIKSLIIRKQ